MTNSWWSRLRSDRQHGWRALQPIRSDEWWLLLAIVVVAAWIRLHDLDYNTVYLDEADNISIARRVLAGQLSPSPIGYHLGWYLFPLMAWWADQLGGAAGMRAMTGVLGIGTLLAVMHTTRRLSGTADALAAGLLLAPLSPFVFAGRVAYREAATLCFFAVGVALFVEASATHRRRMWVASAISIFAAFLIKHPLAIFGPPLVGLALLEGARARRYFAVLLSTLCITYVAVYWSEMEEMWRYLQTSTDYLRAPAGELARIYVRQRIDVWLLLALAVMSLALDRRTLIWPRLAMFGGALLFAVVHVTQRADYNTYRQAAYVLLLLIPLAVPVFGQLVGRLRSASIAMPARATQYACVLIAVPLALAGRDWTVTRADVAFPWTNNSFATQYLRAWTGPARKVLVDDQTLRYSLWPEYRPEHIVDPFYFAYEGQTGPPAYTAAVRDGAFDFIVLGTGMLSSIAPDLPPHYGEVGQVTDSLTGAVVRVYRRLRPPIAPPAPRSGNFVITDPVADARVAGASVPVRGVLLDRRSGESVQVEVLTNRWWPQGVPVGVDPVTGVFETTAWLGGADGQRCHHAIRARVRDLRGRVRYTAMVTDIARVNPTFPDSTCDGR